MYLESVVLKPLSILSLVGAITSLLTGHWTVALLLLGVCFAAGLIGQALHPDKSFSELARGTLSGGSGSAAAGGAEPRHLASPSQQAREAHQTTADASLASERGWKAYKSQQEKFLAVFPDQVSRQFFGFLEDDGEPPGSVVYSSKSGDGVMYEVRVTRVMEYYGSAEEFLKTALVEMARSMTDCIIVRQKRELFRGCPAIAFEASVRSIMSLCGVVALREKTLYMLSVCFRSGARHDLPRFCDGFEMLR